MVKINNPPFRRGLGNTVSPRQNGEGAAGLAVGGLPSAGRPIFKKDLPVIMAEEYGLEVQAAPVVDVDPMVPAPVVLEPSVEEPVNAVDGSTGAGDSKRAPPA